MQHTTRRAVLDADFVAAAHGATPLILRRYAMRRERR